MKSSAFTLLLVAVSLAFVCADGYIIDSYSGNTTNSTTDSTTDPTIATTTAPTTNQYTDEVGTVRS